MQIGEITMIPPKLAFFYRSQCNVKRNINLLRFPILEHCYYIEEGQLLSDFLVSNHFLVYSIIWENWSGFAISCFILSIYQYICKNDWVHEVFVTFDTFSQFIEVLIHIFPIFNYRKIFYHINFIKEIE